MLRISYAAVIIFWGSLVTTGQITHSDTNSLTLLFIGDIMGHDEQISAAENTETHTYNFDDVFSYIKPIIYEADIAIANFEVTLAGPPYKGYPHFSSPSALAAACHNAGIDCLVTANNHAADRGKRGIVKTIYNLDSLEIPHTGTFLNSNNKDTLNPLIIKRKEISIALLNYTYGTNGINVPGPVIINMLDPNQVSTDIEKAKSLSPDIIILFLHWGTEYDTLPSETQADLVGYFFSKGADIIIGSHPHVLQKMEWTKKTPDRKDAIVIFSLGNFVSNQQKPKTDGGSMVRVDLIKNENGQTEIKNAGYYLSWVYTPVETDRKKFFILPCSIYENKPEFFDTQVASYTRMKRFINESRTLLYNQNRNVYEYIFTGNNWIMSK